MPHRSPDKSRASSALALVAALGLTTLVAGQVDVARRGGGIKGDEATYIGLAASAGIDGDLVYTGADYQRFREWYGGGPEGLFLKRGVDGGLYFGKAFLYGLLAAPFARAAGPGGLLAFNVACLSLVVFAGYAWLRPGSHPLAALILTLTFVLASIAPFYAFWLTSDTLNFALVFVAFALATTPPGSPPRSPLAKAIAGLVLGAAIFSKPLNLPLAVPLALVAGKTNVKRVAGALSLTGAVVALFFALNLWITGELNYQGGDRKTFYGRFPYDEGGDSFDSTGIDMTTNTVQTPVGGEGRAASIVSNMGYFVAGRHFGLVPFGWPWLVALRLWIVGERSKTLWQWALVASLTLAALGTIVWMPYTWSGGGGPVGNRYFLSLGAASFFLLPRVQSFVPAALAALGLVFVWPTLSDPFTIAKQPWTATATRPFRMLPLELTGASDFPAILDQRRGRIPQGQRPTLFVALLDEAAGMGQGGWMSVAPRRSAELLVRSPERLQNVTVGIKSTRACPIALAAGESRGTLTLGSNDRQDTDLSPSQVFSRDSFVFVLDVDASACEAPVEVALQGKRQPVSGEPRQLGQ